MALNIKKLMTPDHPEVTFPPPPLIASKGHEELGLENHVGEDKILLEKSQRESIQKDEDLTKILDVI